MSHALKDIQANVSLPLEQPSKPRNEHLPEAKNAQLRVSHLSWQVDQLPILNDISFAITAGQFVGLIGPNGAGKSSLLRCLYRYVEASAGTIEFNGIDAWQYQAIDYAKHVAVVLQESPSHFNLSVYDVASLGLLPNQSMFCGVFGGVSAADKEKVINALNQVGLIDKIAQSFSSLSGGEKQRALIARAIVQAPSFLIMDEPTSHLDIKYQIQIMELAKSLGITVLVSFHDLNLASAMCDQLLVLDQGRLVANDCPEKVLTTELISDVFGICAQISEHPQHSRPHLTYFYGYENASSLSSTRAKGVSNEIS